MRQLIALAILFVTFSSAEADQESILDYAKARYIFWGQLYPEGGKTLYCAQGFTNRVGLQIDHIYPASWMVDHLQCGSRKNCRRISQRFNLMEADLHNLYPVTAEINAARSNMMFGHVLGEEREFGNTCDFEINKGGRVAEPPPSARGNVARSLYYMRKEYGLPIGPAQLVYLNKWNSKDPPDDEERRRNNVIERLQIKRNPYIDRPVQ